MQGTGQTFSSVGHGDSVTLTISQLADNVTFLEIRLKTENVDFIEATPKDPYGDPIPQAVRGATCANKRCFQFVLTGTQVHTVAGSLRFQYFTSKISEPVFACVCDLFDLFLKIPATKCLNSKLQRFACSA